VELAAEDHSAAADRLGAVISAEIAADAELDAVRESGQEQRGEAARRARALYMSGGSAGMVATLLNDSLLDGDDLGDVLAGLRAVRSIVAADAATIDDADVRLDAAVASSEAVQDLRTQRQALEAEAADAAARAEESLAARAALLAEADAAVVALAFEQRRQEEAGALARAGVTVAALGALPSAAAPNQTADRAVQAAGQVLGVPYQWGAVGPGSFDCSGLTSWAYRQAGVSIPRTSRAQYAALPTVPLAQLAPGDLVFWAHGSDPSSIHHVGLYIGEGRMVHAPRTGDVVRVAALWPGIYGAVRPVTG
ncbi:MAG TPA: C40 family peptidase, partial [Actinomycetales bacterium]|nr:C40 family peptidase [Actinomycetales bacterium]